MHNRTTRGSHTEWLPAAVLAVIAVPALANGPTVGPEHTLETNFAFRATWGDWPLLKTATTRNAIHITEGADDLMSLCTSNRDLWWRDPLIYRFGHRAPMTTIGCREKASPSAHVVFYKMPDGSREAYLHFDLHGPQNTPGHMVEVIRNRLTFGHTSQHEVYRGLARTAPGSDEPEPAPRYDLKQAFDRYVKATYALAPVAAAFGAAASRTTLGTGLALPHQFSANLARNTIQNSIQFGAGAFAQQSGEFVPSTSDRVSERIRSALYRTLFVPGRAGDELAFPRLAAAFGTAYIAHQWHPWQKETPALWTTAGGILARYAIKSIASEFRPEIRRTVKRFVPFKRTLAPAALAIVTPRS